MIHFCGVSAALTWAQLEKIIEAREQEFSLPYFLYFFRYFMLERGEAFLAQNFPG